MSITWKEMVNGVVLTGAPLSYYATPALAAATIQAATIYNPTGGALTVNFYKVPPARAADASTLICTRSIPAGATLPLNEAINHKLQAGTQIFASGNGMTLAVSGVEYVSE